MPLGAVLRLSAVGIAVVPMVLASAYADEAGGLRKCRALQEAQARLACYDAIPLEGTPSPQVVPAPQAAASPQAAPPVVASPNAPTLSDRRSPNAQVTAEQFGSERLPAPTVSEGGPAVATLDTITAIVESYTFYRDGHFAVTLSNGQIWEQLRSDLERALFRRGADNAVEITRGLVGGYNLRLNGAGFFRVTRRK